jgi:tetratricopeptide (TPR) repeat protein
MRFAILLTLCSFLSFGQQVPIDSNHVEQVYAKARSFWYNNADSTVHYLKLTEKLSRQINYQRGEANALKGLGFFSRSNYERLQCYIRALEIRETIQDSLGMGVSLGDIAMVYKDLHDDEKMMAYFNRSLEIRRRINDYGGIALIYIQLGHHEEERGNNEKALGFFNDALKFRELADETNGLAYAHLNLARIHTTLKNYDMATRFVSTAEDEFKQVNNLPGQEWATTVHAQILFDRGDAAEALRLLSPFVNASYADRQHQAQQLRIYGLLASIYEQQKNFERALFFKNSWIEEKLRQEQKTNNEAAQRLALDYEFKVKERELKKVEEDRLTLKKRSANLQLLLIAVGVIMLFVSIVSMRKKISDRLINALTFIGLLLLFEFLIVLIEPGLQSLTNEQPLLILLANALVALAIFPAHQFIEKFFRQRIMRNKKLSERGELTATANS